MKSIKSNAIIAMIHLFFSVAVFGQKSTKTETNKGFAVLELFTSEGCNSCPPADELMGKIQMEYKDQEVYVIAYHVDYWDHQGWKDIFSKAEYTKRQYDYANWFSLPNVYTPQVIINGKQEFVASNETVVRNAIKKILLKPSVANLDLNATVSNKKLTVNYTVNSNQKNSNLILTVIQKNAKNAVKRGENANKILSHFQIVRHLHTIKLVKNATDKTTISLPDNFNTKDFEVIGFVQNTNTGAIEAVSKIIF